MPGSETAQDRQPARFSELIQRLTADVGRLIRAEVALYRAEIGRRALSTAFGIGMVVTSILLLQAVLVALLAGLVTIFTIYVGTLGAIAIVVTGGIMIAAMLCWLGVRRIADALDEKG